MSSMTTRSGCSPGAVANDQPDLEALLDPAAQDGTPELVIGQPRSIAQLALAMAAAAVRSATAPPSGQKPWTGPGSTECCPCWLVSFVGVSTSIGSSRTHELLAQVAGDRLIRWSAIFSRSLTAGVCLVVLVGRYFTIQQTNRAPLSDRSRLAMIRAAP